MLQGAHTHSVDEKGRVILPAGLKDELGSRMKICRGDKKGCLHLYSLHEWDLFCSKINSLPFTKKSAMSRFYITNSYDIALDSQGRFLIPQQLRTLIKLKDEAVVSGAGSRGEVWEPEEYAAYQDSLTYEMIENIMDETGI